MTGRTSVVAAIGVVLFVAALRAPAGRRWPYLVGTLTSALLVVALTPFVEVIGSHPLWTGPTIPVIGRLDVTREELANGLFQGLRLAAVGLAFAVYALRIDHDRLLAGAGWARRSTVAVALATRLLPVLERDARDLRVALRDATPSSGRSGSSRRCSPARSNAASTSRRRWRRAATVARATRGRRNRPGPARPAGARLLGTRRRERMARLAQVDDLRYAYVAGSPVLDGVSLTIDDGEHVALLGPSGGGKSTLLRALAGSSRTSTAASSPDA